VGRRQFSINEERQSWWKGCRASAALCQASSHHSGPQGLGRCPVLSIPQSSSHLFWGDGGHTHPSNARPTAAWRGRGSSWLEGWLSQAHPSARARRGMRRGRSQQQGLRKPCEPLVPDTSCRGGRLHGSQTPLPSAEQGSTQPALRAGAAAAPASSQPRGPTASGTRGNAENVMPEKINKATNEVICIAVSRQDLQRL